MGKKAFCRGPRHGCIFFRNSTRILLSLSLQRSGGSSVSVTLLFLYLFLILWGLNIARSSKDRFGFNDGYRNRSLCILAGCHQRGNGNRSSSCGRNSSPAFQLWRFIHSYLHGCTGASHEHQHTAFHVSAGPDPGQIMHILCIS